MNLIQSGGVNGTLGKDEPTYSTYGFGNYFMLQIKDEIDALIQASATIAVIVAAKPNKQHYDQRFIDMGFSLEAFVFLGREDGADWGSYDAVFILGGETKELHTWLNKTNFSLQELTKCQLLAGDSAGAYVLARNTVVDYAHDGTNVQIVDGFVPSQNLLIAAHVNNNFYHTPELDLAFRTWAVDHHAEYVQLKENETRVSNI